MNSRLYSFFRISRASTEKVPQDEVAQTYRRLRSRTFWGVTAAYSIFYVCRMAFSVVKQPMIDSGILTAGQLGIIGSAMLFVYAVGKFVNGFIADYCNVRRFMAMGLLISSMLNLVIGVAGLSHGCLRLPSMSLFFAFVLLWGVNGWMQSMGSPPGVISLSRWFPLRTRGTYYSLFSATPYLGKFLSFTLIGAIVGWAGWEWGFIFAAVSGLLGFAAILIYVSDTPESKGLPSVQELSGEEVAKREQRPTRELQRYVVHHPGIWVIAISSAFIYVTQYAVSGWGVLFLQKQKSFSLEGATQIIAFSEAFGIAGTVFAGWLSDKVFGGDRVKPVVMGGVCSLAALGLFLFSGGCYLANIAYVAFFSMAIGVVYCIVAGLMALDFVPRKATGAALGIVGISSYAAAGLQDIVSGFLIQGGSAGDPLSCDFGPASWFWMGACLVSFVLPVAGWRALRRNS